MKQNTMPKLFESNSLQFHEIKGDFCLTYKQIAEGLGYKNHKHVLTLYKRYKDELEPYKRGVSLSTPQGMQNAVVFSEEGIYIISMLARTPKAKEFRQRVAKLLKQLRLKRLELARREGSMAYIEMIRRLKAFKKDDTFLKGIIRYRREKGLNREEIAKLLDCSRSTVDIYTKFMKDSGLWEVL